MQKTINDIVKTIHERYKGSTLLPKNRESTRLILVEACRILVEMLKEGNTVFISELGKFELRWTPPKKIIHPVTKEEYTIPDHYKINFTMNKRIRKQITALEYIQPKEDEAEIQEEEEANEEEVT